MIKLKRLEDINNYQVYTPEIQESEDELKDYAKLACTTAFQEGKTILLVVSGSTVAVYSNSCYQDIVDKIYLAHAADSEQ